MVNWSQHNHPGVDSPIPTSYMDFLDARRSGGLSPLWEHPRGYIETVNPSRREDRILGHLAHKESTRNYTRGIHAGSKVRPNDYFWPPEFGPMNGMIAQAAGMKQRPLLEFARVNAYLTNDGKPMPRRAASIYPPPVMGEDLRAFRPPWGW